MQQHDTVRCHYKAVNFLTIFTKTSYIYTVKTPYSTIPYTTKFHITPWTHGPQNLQRPIRTLIVLSVIWIPNHRIILWIIARDTDSEWTHMCQRLSGPADHLILSHLTAYGIWALFAGVNIHFSCIPKGITAFSRVTPLIRTHDQTILTRSFEFDVRN